MHPIEKHRGTGHPNYRLTFPSPSDTRTGYATPTKWKAEIPPVESSSSPRPVLKAQGKKAEEQTAQPPLALEALLISAANSLGLGTVHSATNDKQLK